jgi:hypothetical protein
MSTVARGARPRIRFVAWPLFMFGYQGTVLAYVCALGVLSRWARTLGFGVVNAMGAQDIAVALIVCGAVAFLVRRVVAAAAEGDRPRASCRSPRSRSAGTHRRRTTTARPVTDRPAVWLPLPRVERVSTVGGGRSPVVNQTTGAERGLAGGQHGPGPSTHV